MNNPYCLCTADENGIVLVEPMVEKQPSPFTWRDVKAIVDTMTEGQLDMKAAYSILDIKDGVIAGIDIASEDHYTLDGYIDPESSFKPGQIEELELELAYRKGQPIINL